MLKQSLALLSSLLLSSCTMYIKAPFDQDQARRMMMPGNNTITGSALFKQRGGGIVTCAGREIRLIPATDYAIERVMKVYKNSAHGWLEPVPYMPRFVPDEPFFYTLSKTTMCNVQGFFTFNDIADGDFFVFSNIEWHVEFVKHGGTLMQRIAIQGGQVAEIVISQ